MNYIKIILVMVSLFSWISCSSRVEKTSIKEISVQESAWAKINSGALLLDVRTQEEYLSGHLKGAINIPHDKLETRLDEISASKDKQIVVYCRSGKRAGIAENILKQHGFKDILNAGGYEQMISSKH